MLCSLGFVCEFNNFYFFTDDRIPSRFQSKDGDDLCEEEEEEEGEVSSAGDEVIATELGADPTSA